jgi:hypothetical protein
MAGLIIAAFSRFNIQSAHRWSGAHSMHSREIMTTVDMHGLYFKKQLSVLSTTNMLQVTT